MIMKIGAIYNTSNSGLNTMTMIEGAIAVNDSGIVWLATEYVVLRYNW